MNAFARKAHLQRWAIAIKIVPVIAALIAARAVVDAFDLAFIELSTLFGSMIAANVFVLGFLLAGTLSDYKESERLPGELASSVETITDECLITWRNKRPPEASDAISYMARFSSSLVRWFHKQERTKDVLAQVSGMNEFFLRFESLTQPNFIVRMKQEQNSIRRMVLRIDAIRDTAFLSVGYSASYIGTALLLVGLLFAEIEPYYQAMFYLTAIGFLMIYLTILIRDVDNPFDHYKDGGESASVSLKSIFDLEEKLRSYERELGSAPQSEPDTALRQAAQPEPAGSARVPL